MTVGEKIRQQRIAIGFSQTQLAEKLHVSRAAVAKWENGNGLPDVANLKALADFFHTDVDALLDESKNIVHRQNTEYIDLEEYPITGRCRNSFDAVVISKFPDAYYISPATLVYEFNKAERIVNILTLGLHKCIWQLTHWKEYTGIYYFVETVEHQYLVQFDKAKMTVTALPYRTQNIMREFYVGNRKYLDLGYDLMRKKPV